MVNLLTFVRTFVEDDSRRESFRADPLAALADVADDLCGEDIEVALDVVRAQVAPDVAKHLVTEEGQPSFPRLTPAVDESLQTVALRCLRWIDLRLGADPDDNEAFEQRIRELTGVEPPPPLPVAEAPSEPDEARDAVAPDAPDAPHDPDAVGETAEAADAAEAEPGPTLPFDVSSLYIDGDSDSSDAVDDDDGTGNTDTFDPTAIFGGEEPDRSTADDHADTPVDEPRLDDDARHRDVSADTGAEHVGTASDSPDVDRAETDVIDVDRLETDDIDVDRAVVDEAHETFEAVAPLEPTSGDEAATDPEITSGPGDDQRAGQLDLLLEAESPTEPDDAVTRPSFERSGGGVKLPFTADSPDLPFPADDSPAKPFSGGSGPKLPFITDTDDTGLPFDGDAPVSLPSVDHDIDDDIPASEFFSGDDALEAPDSQHDAGTDDEIHFRTLDVVLLPVGIPEVGIPAGARATVVAVHTEPTLHYEIEVDDAEGVPTFLGTVTPETLAPISD